MAWIYLAESEESQKPWTGMFSLSPTVKTTDMPKPFCSRGCPQENCLSHPFGTTFARYKQNLSDKFRSFTAASRAKIFLLQDAERVWNESEADYFSRSLDSLKTSNQLSFFSKMSLQSEREEPILSSENFPAYGMTVDGVCYPLRMWERITAEKDGGFWPTASARDWKDTPGMARMRPDGKSRIDQLARAVYAKMWPTPTMNMVSGGANHSSPTVKAGKHGINLKGAVMKWPTPTVQMSRPDMNRQNRPKSGSDDLGSTIKKQTGGQLNPTWVEWLMGYRSEWTVLEPWAIAWFRPKREKRLKD